MAVLFGACWMARGKEQGKVRAAQTAPVLQPGIFLPASHPLNPTKSSFVNKLHIARSEYQLLPGEEHICRHSKAKHGDVRGV